MSFIEVKTLSDDREDIIDVDQIVYVKQTNARDLVRIEGDNRTQKEDNSGLLAQVYDTAQEVMEKIEEIKPCISVGLAGIEDYMVVIPVDQISRTAKSSVNIRRSLTTIFAKSAGISKDVFITNTTDTPADILKKVDEAISRQLRKRLK